MKLINVMSPTESPYTTINPGKEVIIETEDCFSGMMRKEEDYSPEVMEKALELICPVCGPIVVKGAKPGDWVKIKIEDIECGDYAISVLGRKYSAIGEELGEDRIRVVPIKNREVIFNEKIKFPVRPMVGTIGTTPKIGMPKSNLQGRYCGNVDCPSISIGNTVYIPVFIEGAYIYVGDVHAIQGDGEMINPFETPATIRMTIDIDRSNTSEGKWPRVITENTIETIAVDRDFYQAAKIALFEMLKWMVDEFGFDFDDAAYMCGQIANARPCQIVNERHSARCVVEKKYLFYK